MRILADQNIYASTIRHLRGLGHDVVEAEALGLARAPDEELLRRAQSDGRILLTRDRDFGALAFAYGIGAGVIYLRMSPSTLQVIHAELDLVLKTYSEENLINSFVVVEPGRHRHRQVGP